MKEVLHHQASLRDAASRWNLNFVTLSRYVKRAKLQGSDTIINLSMKTKQVCLRCFNFAAFSCIILCCFITYVHTVFFLFQIITDDEEAALKNYILKASKLYRGLNKQSVKKLAYEFGKAKNINIPANWLKNKAAGEEWLKGFRRRHKETSLRQPEATSLARASAFNKHNVEAFFTNLKQVLSSTEGKITPQNIYNLDETGVWTVQKPKQIFAAIGVKQVSRVTSAEHGENMTMCACINALGHALPPAYFFHRSISNSIC